MNDFFTIRATLLLLISFLFSKLSNRFGVPALLLLLVLGMLAGFDGPGCINFDDPALALILFSGGLDTEWKRVRPVLKNGLLLSTAGVLITALAVCPDG
jgi:cell volume regulation protein A